jgi:tetratricopeptide (TPR) repeat protein
MIKMAALEAISSLETSRPNVKRGLQRFGRALPFSEMLQTHFRSGGALQPSIGVTCSDGARRNEWLRRLFVGLGIFILTCAAYFPAFAATWNIDDSILALGNRFVAQPGGIKDIWIDRHQIDYFPVTITSFWLEYRLWGPSCLGFHLTQIFLHACCALLLWVILRDLKIPGAALGALLFAVHPVNVETAAWVAEQKNTLSFLFTGLALLAFRRRGGGSGRWFYAASIALFVIALLSKTSPVAFGFILLLIGWYENGRITRRDVLAVVPFLVAALLLGAVTFRLQMHESPDSIWLARPLINRIAQAGISPWFYLYESLVPIHLATVYPELRIYHLNFWTTLPLIACIGTAGGLFWARNTRLGRPVAFALGVFILALAPVLGVANMSYLAFSPVTDHFTYLALPAITGLVAAMIAIALRRPRALALWNDRFDLMVVILMAAGIVAGEAVVFHAMGLAMFPGLAGAIIGGGAVMSGIAAGAVAVRRGVKPWRAAALGGGVGLVGIAAILFIYNLRMPPQYTFFDAVGYLPPALIALCLGVGASVRFSATRVRKRALMTSFIVAVTGTFTLLTFAQSALYANPLALWYYDADRHPSSDVAYQALGTLFQNLDDNSDALIAFRRSLQLNASSRLTWAGLGRLYAIMGDYQKSMDAYEHAGDIGEVGWCKWKLGDRSEGLKLMKGHVSLDADFARTYYHLALAFEDMNDPGNADFSFRQYLIAAPSDDKAHIEYGTFLLTYGHNADAATQFLAALDINRATPSAKALFNLGIAQTALGDAAAAQQSFAHALTIDPTLRAKMSSHPLLPIP